jgi:hypothetical protein
MILEALHRYGAKADRIMMFPEGWQINATDLGIKERVLTQARDLYQTKLIPIEVQSFCKRRPNLERQLY